MQRPKFESRDLRWSLTVPSTIAVLAMVLAVTVRTGRAQEEASLGAVARQTRSDKNPQSQGSHKAQDLVDEMVQEQEASDAAPTGFKSYNAGDYRLFVPYPFELEGRDDRGTVLAGSRLGVTNTEVLVGNPIPIPTDLSDHDLSDAVNQAARQYSQSAGCLPMKVGERRAFHCGMNNGQLLGHQVWGTIMVVVGSNSLIPVVCVSPDAMDEHLVYGSRRASWQEKQAAYARQDQRFRDEHTTAQVCDQIIYPSIRLKEDVVVHPATISGKPGKVEAVPVGTPASVPQAATSSATPDGSAPASLGELARKSRQAPRVKAQTTLDNAEGKSTAPPGFQSFSFQYCENPQRCREASMVIPAKAEVLSRVNSQHVFRSELDGETLMLYAGPADVNAPYRSLTDRDYIRMRDLANSNGWSREKVDSVATQELTLDGKYALMTRFRYKRDEKAWWIGERALIENHGTRFLVGCTAPEEHFADAEVVCTTLVNSLRLP